MTRQVKRQVIRVDDTRNIFGGIAPPKSRLPLPPNFYPSSPTGALPFSVTDDLHGGADDKDFHHPVGYWETSDDEGLNEEEYRPFTLWLHGYSCYQIDKHESGENITIPCADLTPPELLHLGRSIMKVLDEYGVDL